MRTCLRLRHPKPPRQGRQA